MRDYGAPPLLACQWVALPISGVALFCFTMSAIASISARIRRYYALPLHAKAGIRLANFE
ncbi:MAG: hypothetical protein COW59_12365 [Lysobacterales bacterium CG17_big_fil_post_rev_8_21_14_2_50_64_11]|nr:MAG: hypothetical protein COW59_12365 [Xanthomonadales bacterium CG17_big_fil_post_rev_8_21_14_2_50_64_11]